MIKLIFQIGSQRIERVFRQDSVLVGATSPDLRDLPFDTSGLLPEHVKVFARNGGYFVQNLVNDPFVTVNEHPFGKRKLVTGDRITIGELEIYFEDHHPATQIVPSAASKASLHSLADSLDHSIRNKNAAPSHSAAVEEDEDLEALIREVENFESDDDFVNAKSLEEDEKEEEKEVSERPVRSSWTGQQHRQSNRITSRGVETAELSEAVRHHFGIHPTPRPSFWRPLFAVILVLIAIMAAVASGVYFTFSEQNDAEEYIAAQGLADMAMGLTYAHIHQTKPPNLNWADPDFLKESIAKVLPPAYPSLASIDKQGSFTNSPYMLRIYTNSDLSQFLLIAQPEPGLWQWLLSHETILLDSRTMELRKTSDLRALNRLLANPKPLEGANALEVSHLVGQGSLIRLTSLADEMGHREFLPPKGLSKAMPGAENHIYNAPRYYQMSLPIVQTLADAAKRPSSLPDDGLQALRNRVVDFTKLSSVILYSPLEEAVTQKIVALLANWFPDHPPRVAQLQLEGIQGGVQSSFLVDSKPVEPIATEKPAEEATVAEATTSQEPAPSSLQHQLQAPLEERREMMESLKRQLISLIDGQIVAPSPDFAAEASELIHHLDDVDLGAQVDIHQALVDAYRAEVLENKTIAHETFVNDAQKWGLTPFLPKEFLAEHAEEATPPGVKEEAPIRSVDFSVALSEILQAQNFEALESAVANAHRELAQTPVAEGDKLRKLRNKLQLQVVHRIEQLILGSSSTAPDSAFDRDQIRNILETVGVRDEEQVDYYLQEFDLTAKQKHPHASDDNP